MSIIVSCIHSRWCVTCKRIALSRPNGNCNSNSSETRASVNHVAAVRRKDSRRSGNVIIRLLIERFGETLVEQFMQWTERVSRKLQVHPRKQPRLNCTEREIRWLAEIIWRISYYKIRDLLFKATDMIKSHPRFHYIFYLYFVLIFIYFFWISHKYAFYKTYIFCNFSDEIFAISAFQVTLSWITYFDTIHGNVSLQFREDITFSIPSVPSYPA